MNPIDRFFVTTQILILNEQSPVIQLSQLTQRSLMMLVDVPITKLRKEIGARLVLNRLEALIRKRSALDGQFHSQ